MQKTKHWLMTIAALLCSIMVNAQTFKVNGINYTITSEADLTVEVSRGGDYSQAITIPSNVTYNNKIYLVTGIGVQAFENCLLNSVTIPSSVIQISDQAFCNCENLYSIIIPEGVVSIGDRAFSLTPIEDVYIPSSIKKIGNSAFGGHWDACFECDDYFYVSYPENYYVDSNNDVYSSYNGILYDKEQTTMIAFPHGKGGDVIIPSTVTTISQQAFNECYYIENIYCYATIPPSIISPISGDHMLYVPMKSMAYYAEASIWNKMTIQPIIPEGYTGLVTLYGRSFEDWDWGYTHSDLETIVKKKYNFNAVCGDMFSFTYSMVNYDMSFIIKVDDNVVKRISERGYHEGEFSYILTEDGNHTISIECYIYEDALSSVNEWVKIENVKLGCAVYTQQRLELGNWTSTNKEHNSKSTHTYTFIGDAGSTLSFDWETSTEQDYDKLICELDGDIILTQSGIKSGTYTRTLTSSGKHTLMVTYSKDVSAFNGNDLVSVKNVLVEQTFEDYANIEKGSLNDNSPNFTVYETTSTKIFTYTRTFNNTNWQALYVPFEIPVTEEFLADFEVADLNDVRQYDRNDDGVKDETVIEAFKVKSGVLEANYPYLIRAREAGEKTITVTDATLYATEENSIDCSSVREKFTFTGTYSQLSSEELPQGEGYYALSGGVWQPVAEGASLGAFRFYLKVDSRNSLNAAQGNAIRMRIIGEDGEEDDATRIDTPEFKTQKSELIFDLQGRRVENPTKGVYIVNGVKRVF